MTIKQYLGIEIDESRTEKMKDESVYLIRQHYAKEGETVQEALARAAVCWSSNIEHAQRLYDASSTDMFMWASPAFSNAVKPAEKPKALPISCFLPYVGDSVPDLLYQRGELALLSVMGGGVGQDWSHVRPVSKKAPGPIPFIHENDSSIMAWKQGSTRRGALAVALSIDHPDAPEFLRIRVPTGDASRKCLNLHNSFNVTDSFMMAVERGDQTFDLVNPASKKVEGTINPREFFNEIITVRGRTGEPFTYFIDTAQRQLPLPQRYLGMTVKATNICTEITLAASKKRTPVCCLSSLNAEHMDTILKTGVVGDVIEALDNIISFFIENVDVVASNYEDPEDQELIRLFLRKVKNSAERERSIGLGVMGWHYYLQSKEIAFASEEAVEIADKVFKEIKDQAHAKSVQLGKERGVPPDIQEYIEACERNGDPVDEYWRYRRNLHLIALAPNANNSMILGTSPSIEMLYANIYTQEMRIGPVTIKNKVLQRKLASLGKDTEEVWNKIIEDKGSVKGLDFLTEHEKLVFATSLETDMMWVVRQAIARQKHICQAQSLNLVFPPGSDINYVANVHYVAWKGGLKSLYYYRTETEVKVEKMNSQVERVQVEEVKKTIVYGTPTCQQCNAAKALLSAKGIEYEYIDLVKLGKTAAEVTGRPVRSVPQVYIEGVWIGGLKEVMEYLSKSTEQDSENCVSCEG